MRKIPVTLLGAVRFSIDLHAQASSGIMRYRVVGCGAVA